MKRFILAFSFIFFLLCFSLPANAASPEQAIYKATKPQAVRLDTVINTDTGAGEICTATVIQEHVLLTATHCLYNPMHVFLPKSIYVNGMATKIIDDKIVSDGSDHTILETDGNYVSVAKFADRPEESDSIFFWGNPDGHFNFFRKAYVTTVQNQMFGIDVNGFFGDSGAGLFNEDGKLVGTISNIYPSSKVLHNDDKSRTYVTFSMMTALNYTFSENDLKKVNLSIDDNYKHLIGPKIQYKDLHAAIMQF